jgi:hypothetical protein
MSARMERLLFHLLPRPWPMDPRMVSNIRGQSFVHLYFVNLSGCGTMQYETYVMDGTRPMTVNPIPKTSNGVKLRLNSSCGVSHVCSARRDRPCLYPRLANSSSSVPSVPLPPLEPRSDARMEFCAAILPPEKTVIAKGGEGYRVRGLSAD